MTNDALVGEPLRTARVAPVAGKFKMGARCSSACATKNHRTFGECVRSKGVHLNPNLSNTNVQKDWDRELDFYESAVAQGVQPRGTKRALVEEAMNTSDATGVAYKA